MHGPLCLYPIEQWTLNYAAGRHVSTTAAEFTINFIHGSKVWSFSAHIIKNYHLQNAFNSVLFLLSFLTVILELCDLIGMSMILDFVVSRVEIPQVGFFL